jgi:hypothetical protein
MNRLGELRRRGNDRASRGIAPCFAEISADAADHRRLKPQQQL